MLIDFPSACKRQGVTPTGILHLGAHDAEEVVMYRRHWPKMPVWWVEANPALIDGLERKLGRWANHHVIGPVAAGPQRGEVEFHVANNGQSSSVLDLGTHAQVHPEIHYTADVVIAMDTVDNMAAECHIEANVLVMDIQGGEGGALQGAWRFLEGCHAVYSEINQRELYKGCWLLPEQDSWLGFRGFELRELVMAGSAGWGDALWVRA